MATRLANAGRDPFAHHGYVNTPVYHASTLLYESAEDYLAHRGRYQYGRRGTPTSEALQNALAELEGEQCHAVALLPSGLAAASVAILSVVRSGDHLLVTDSVYGPTRSFCDDILPRYGIATTYYDPTIAGGIAALMQPSTRAVFVESPGSLSFEVQDVPAIAAVAHAADAVVLMDNTWASPIYFPALEKGVDIAIQSGTKYVGGHSDVMLGIAAANEHTWKRLERTVFDMGLCVGPDDMFLGLRGLRTMGLRLAHQCAAGMKVARWLEARPEDPSRAPPRARKPSGPRPVETRFYRRFRAVQRRVQAGAGPCRACLSRCADAVRNRRLVGRVRKPRHTVRLWSGPHRNVVGTGRTDRAFPHRA